MTLANRYLLYIILLHLALAGTTYFALEKNKLYFLASELGIAGSLGVALYIYQAFRKPANFVSAGIEAIREKDFSIKFVETGNAEIDELIQVYNLMIDQLRLERTRQAEQQFFLDKLISAAPITLLILDYDARVSAVNPKARALLRLPDSSLLGKSLSAIDHPLMAHLENLAPDQPHTIKLAGVETYRVLRGQFIDRGFARQFVFLEELTAEIVETEKRAYGKVIRMMAHEVNNSIGAVNSILHVAEPDIPDPDIRQAVRVAIDRNDRLNSFMRRFADVVRLPIPHRVATDLRTLVTDVARLMRPQADSREVSLQVDLPAEPIMWSIDAAQLEQVLVNVVKNALEACQSGNTVQINLTTNQVSIQNNGQPIPDVVATNLFEPFFSTRATGQGIGLTLTREILLNHGFSFSLRTEPSGWTVFRIEC
ncbi:MAG: histidine kinase [Cytophagales bacterium]|nr:MAG: histidine kinase [Cytophagales bacterium]